MYDASFIATVLTAISGCIALLIALRYILQALLGQHKKIDVRNKHCLVTGGSSGIGLEVAKVNHCYSNHHSVYTPCVTTSGHVQQYRRYDVANAMHWLPSVAARRLCPLY